MTKTVNPVEYSHESRGAIKRPTKRCYTQPRARHCPNPAKCGTIGGMIHLRAIRLNSIPAVQPEPLPFNIPAVHHLQGMP